MSGKFLTLCVVGLLGSLFVGYCVYFDKKRRSDPDYKKKVVASKLLSFTYAHILWYTVCTMYSINSMYEVKTLFCVCREKNEKAGRKEKHH